MNNTGKENQLMELVRARTAGERSGIYSCCSANEYVLKAAMLRGMETDTPVLIEATANQVNQFGGYTGMRPADFYRYVISLAKEVGFPVENLILGGDHLGSLTWAEETEDMAMEKAKALVREFVLAGFTKIHLDTSMRLADDSPSERLSDETIARRGAALCMAAEEAYVQRKTADGSAVAPVYIIGSEVPIPGGAREAEDSVCVTAVSDCLETYEVFRQTFAEMGLENAWSRVIAMVVQPGVEFGDSDIIEYDREKAKELTGLLKRLPIVFEGHSTDYQTKEALREMVEDGIAILKVGPALTFALREALFSLEQIERELYAGSGTACSEFRDVLEHVMLEDDKNWKKYYHGNGNRKKFARAFSLSDRARYYLPESHVKKAVARLIRNLRISEIPLSLISQYMPMQYTKVRGGILKNDPEDLLLDRIGNYIDDYLYATMPGGK